MMSKEEEAFDKLWWEGQNLLTQARHYGSRISEHFISFHENGLDTETIAAAFSVPVEDVIHDIDVYNRGLKMMKTAAEMAEVWDAKKRKRCFFRRF